MRAAVAALFLSVWAASSMAQITEPMAFNVLARSNRQAGTYLTATAQIPEGVYSLGISDLLTDADASDPANSFRFIVRVSQNGIDWSGPGTRILFVLDWQGGTHLDKRTGQIVPNHVSMSWSDSALAAGELVGWRVRGELDQPMRMSSGFRVTVYPPDFDPQ